MEPKRKIYKKKNKGKLVGMKSAKRPLSKCITLLLMLVAWNHWTWDFYRVFSEHCVEKKW